jgi:hypothetical protein|tara:strand:+ start:541 stop:876 length:336 start_codon:yes stop_codon:yes gene_type:complete
MSLMPSTTKGGEQWQHCNYGYDRSKYNSMEDCMKDIDPSTKDELTDYGKQLQQQNRPFYDRLGNQYGYSSTSMWNKSAIKYFDGSGKKQLIAVLLLVSGLYYVYSKGLLKK